ncbi:hypothetical protein SKAU_G00192450 [Synaphobranchus kaupii]|uniref:Secreted protein n=1 Tax=Synaphobranchus kaupii TaxID=118154 RepID=A0A9Q1FDZ2_SYNKA|nr:hypothetical protein SKAU_G00192450 [Synaphobranchus kaupii]
MRLDKLVLAFLTLWVYLTLSGLKSLNCHHELSSVQELRWHGYRHGPGPGQCSMHALRFRVRGQHHSIRGAIRGKQWGRILGRGTVRLFRW